MFDRLCSAIKYVVPAQQRVQLVKENFKISLKIFKRIIVKLFQKNSISSLRATKIYTFLLNHFREIKNFNITCKPAFFLNKLQMRTEAAKYVKNIKPSKH